MNRLWAISKYKLVLSSAFKRDLKLAVKRKCDISKLEAAVEILMNGKALSESYKDHKLTRNWDGHKEYH